MRRGGRSSAASWVLAAIPLAFLAVFFVWPVGRILTRGLRPGGQWDVGAFTDVLGQGRIRSIVWFTVWQAVASTVLTLALALPGAYVLARVRFRGRSLVRAAVTVPFVLPTVVVASAFLGIAGPRGLFTGAGDLRGTVWAILLAHAFFNYAVVIRVVGGLWSHLDPALEDAARTLGATRWRAFREVTWPLLRPAVVAASSIVFLFCFTSFGVIVLLGGLSHSTVEAEIYRAAVTRLDLRTASVLAVVQLVTVVVLLVVFARATERGTGARRLLAVADVARPPASVRERLFLRANLVAMAVLLSGPLAVLVERSFHTTDGYGLAWYRALSSIPARSALFVPPLEAVRNSLLIALAATVIAIIVGGCAAFAVAGRGRSPRGGRGLDLLLMLPLGTSAVTVGFGFLIALDRPPLDLRASWWIVPLAHALVAVPFVVRIVVPVLRAIDPRMREAASSLGAAPGRVVREIDVPIVRRAVLVAAGFAFAISLGEFGATAFIARADAPTVPTAIFRSLSQPGAANFGSAMAMSTILMVLTGTSILVIERLRLPGADTF
ncbi:MAG: thiamine transport system permease protein [Acidimicrobiaceae bacterium]